MVRGLSTALQYRGYGLDKQLEVVSQRPVTNVGMVEVPDPRLKKLARKFGCRTNIFAAQSRSNATSRAPRISAALPIT